MELEFGDGTITLDKELNQLDELALMFSRSLVECDIAHVFLSGYVSILFGRSRSSEDIDVVTEPLDAQGFEELWNRLLKDMDCIITDDPHSAFEDYLLKDTAIRFAMKDEFVPNVDIKFATDELQVQAIKEHLTVVLNGEPLMISPLEQQVAYKLYLGSEKDIEDARFIFKLFSDRLDEDELTGLIRVLELDLTVSKKYLGWET